MGKLFVLRTAYRHHRAADPDLERSVRRHCVAQRANEDAMERFAAARCRKRGARFPSVFFIAAASFDIAPWLSSGGGGNRVRGGGGEEDVE